MKHQNYLYLEYRRALRKFRKLQTRFEKRIANNTFQELTARRRYQLLSRLRKLKEKIEQLTSRLKLAAAGGSLAFTMGLALGGHEAEAQVQGVPKVLSIDKTLANDATTSSQRNPSVGLNNEGNFAIVWEDNNDGSLQGKGYGGDVEQSLDFSIPLSTEDTYYVDPSIAINEDDQFIVAWADSGFAIKYMRYEVEGDEITADGPYTVIEETNEDYVYNPDVALDEDGNFVITWSQHNGSDYDVKAKYYTSDNVSAGVLDVSQNTSYDQKSPAVDIDNEGNFIIIWGDEASTGSAPYGFVTGRKYVAGIPDDDEQHLVQEFDASRLKTPDVDLNGDGSFVVAWEYSANPGTTEYVRAQVFDAEGSAASSKMNIATSSFIDNPKIAADKDGGFAVAYVTSSGQEIKIEGSRHNRFGSQIETVEFYNENYTGNSANHPAIGMNDQGDFVVAWNDNLSDVNSSTCNEDTDCDGTGVYFKKYGDPESEPYCVVDESQVNDYSTGYQQNPAVDVDINGNYVIVWEGEWHGSLEDSQGILGQRYKADGTKDGEEFHVNTSTNSNQSSPDVAMDGSGHFIVTWSGYAGTSRTGIFAQMYSSDGAPNGSEFRVDQETTSYYQLSEPSVDINHDGDAVIVWEGSYGSEINARVINGPNSFDGNEFKVNASTFSGARNYPDVAIQDDDSFVVTWGSWVSGGEDQTFIRRFDSNASALDANDVRISSNYNTQTRRQSIAMDKASGDFMVVFTEYAGSYSSILASKYKSDGSSIFTEEELTDRAYASDEPDLAANLNGEFAIVWNQTYGDGHVAMSMYNGENELAYEGYEAINPDGQEGVAVALDLDGNAIVATSAYYGPGNYNIYTKTIAPPLAGNVDNGMEFIVNSITSDNQTSPDVAQNADGDFVVVWRDTYAGQAIKAQRYNEKGIRQGSEIIVNNNTSTSSRYPSVALNDEGNFMVVWHFYNGGTGGEDVMGSVYDWNGEVVKDDFILNSDETDGHQVYPDIALDENGDFRVIWSSTTYSDDSYSAIATKKFSPTGVAESAVTNYLTDDVLNVNDHRGSIAINEDGDIAVSYTYGYDGYELYLNVFNKALESQVEDLQISNSNEIKVFKPAITATEDGDFVVAWVEGSDYHDLLVRKYSSGATFDGNAIEIDAGDRPNEAGIQAVDDGDFILTFVDEIDDSGDYDGIWAQRLSYEMEKIGPEFLVNDTTQNDHSNSAMASSPDGSYTVVWEADYTDGSNYAVMAKQFVSHKPTVEVNDLSLDEGAEADITSDELLISNPSGGDESPLLTVTLLPSQGTLKLDGNAITLNQQLNEDDMFFLSYEHNGEEGTFDLFTFTVANEDFETGTNSFYISVNPVNDVPTVANPIPDQSTTGFESFSYTVPANTFTDVESEELTLSATLSNGSNLPSWLSFNAATRTFSGTVENDPDFDRTITIKVSASDGEASASDEFNIAIASVLTVDESNPNGVQLYPNPTEGQLHLRPPAHMVGTIDLYMFNASGQLLDQSRIEQTRASMVIDIDVAHLKKGLYLLKLVNENATTTYKINKD